MGRFKPVKCFEMVLYLNFAQKSIAIRMCLCYNLMR